MIFFSNPHIGRSENALKEVALLEGKSAYGYPPSPSPLPTYALLPRLRERGGEWNTTAVRREQLGASSHLPPPPPPLFYALSARAAAARGMSKQEGPP